MRFGQRGPVWDTGVSGPLLRFDRHHVHILASLSNRRLVIIRQHNRLGLMVIAVVLNSGEANLVLFVLHAPTLPT